MPFAVLPVHLKRYTLAAGWEAVEMPVIAEAEVALTVNGEPWLSFACTPTDLEALAVGFLYNEGFIQKREEIAAVDVCKTGENVDVWLDHPVKRPANWQRTSGCTGGLTAVSDAQQPAAKVETGQQIAVEVLLRSMQLLMEAQDLHREAGGVHCSALSDGCAIRVRAEDIGRHNTLDKLAGRLLLDGTLPIRPAILLTTGRISSEMLQKAYRLGASVVMSHTSPTSQSVALAEQLGITLVGYARRNSFMVYAHPERISG